MYYREHSHNVSILRYCNTDSLKILFLEFVKIHHVYNNWQWFFHHLEMKFHRTLSDFLISVLVLPKSPSIMSFQKNAHSNKMLKRYPGSVEESFLISGLYTIQFINYSLYQDQFSLVLFLCCPGNFATLKFMWSFCPMTEVYLA